MLEKIKQALGEELSEQVATKLSEAKIELGIANDGSLVPADKHDSMKSELKSYQEQLEKVQKQLEETGTKEQTIEELKQQLNQAKEDYNQFKADTEKREVTNTKKNAVIKALEEAGAIKSSIDLLANTINLEELQIDKQGNIVDKDTIITDLKTQREGLFVEKKLDGAEPPRTAPGIKEDDLSDQAFFEAALKQK